MAQQNDLTTNRLFTLDFIRSLSIIFIIFYHFNIWINRNITAELIISSCYTVLGIIGVSLFIVLSGASLSLSNPSPFSISRFYWKRFMAIFPLFYVSYLFILLLRVFLKRGFLPDRAPESFLLTLIGMDGFFIFKVKTYYLIGEWFLGFIIILYIVYPIIRFVFMKKMLMVLFIAAGISFGSYYYYDAPMFIFRFPPVRLFEFVLGMYIMTAFRTISINERISFMILSSCFITICLYSNLGQFLYVRFVLLGSATYVFLYCSASFFDLIWLRPPINYLSKYSYGAFLVHHQIIYFVPVHYHKMYVVDKLSNAIFFLILLAVIFFISFLLTNLTTYILRIITKQTKLIRDKT